ncbi:MAG: DUF6495 family protein [Flavobacteriaceae bacterium]
MKYTRLTKEQFEELHQEFARFLASQSITKDEWELLKNEQPHVAEEELDVFSDLIWEGALAKVMYLENLSPQQWFLFKLEKEHMSLIVVKALNSIDLTSSMGMKWLEKHLDSKEVELFKSQKVYATNRNLEVFQLIQKGAVISKGHLFESLANYLNL